MRSGYAYIWEFRVKPDAVGAFQELYGPDGAWVRLFRRSSGYLHTELHHDLAEPTRFVTVDHWRSKADLQESGRRFKDEWATIDAAGEALTESERLIGEFSCVSADPGDWEV